jgi:predicted MFS family arabinose efflux permease/nucleotide-binding universal stress UspA family protein
MEEHMSSLLRRSEIELQVKGTSPAAHRGREIWIALGLAAGAMVALGFTRFAYALLLPSMRTDLDWSFTAAGGMNTANAVGYIAGAATAAWWARRLGPRVAFVGGMALSSVALLLSGALSDYTALCAIRLVGGVATAVTFVLGSALAARVHTGGSHRRSALLVSVYMTGVGLGIILSGIIVPSILAHSGPTAWDAGWIVMGAVAVALLVPATWAVRHVPPAPSGHADATRPPFRPLRALFAWYVLFGAGYVSYMTFVIALLHDESFDTGQIATFFIVLGASSVIATLTFWGRMISHLRGGQAPALISIVVLAGVLPVLLADGATMALASAVIFGSSFMAGPTAATVLARRMLPPHGWTSGIAALTVAFSVGQGIGPLLAGALSDTNGGIALGLWLSVFLLAVAACAAALQKDTLPEPEDVLIDESERRDLATKETSEASPSITAAPFHRILVAIDASPQRDRVLATAAELAAAARSSVRVLHVDAEYEAYDTASDAETEAAAEDLVHRAVAELRARGVDADGVVAHLAEADIDDAILSAAAKHGSDLIVLGSERRHGIGSWLESSVTDPVIHRAASAVLLVA